MPMDISGFVTTDPLANIALRVMNKATDYVGGDVAPNIFVPKKKFKWYLHDFSELRDENDDKDAGSPADKIEYGVSQKEGKAKLRKLGAEVNPEHERDADQPVANIEQSLSKKIATKLLIGHERRVQTEVATAANYGTGLTTTLAAGSTLADGGASSPIDLFDTARLAVRGACGMLANAAVTSLEVVTALLKHPELIGRIQGIKAEMTIEQLKALLKVQYLFIGSALRNSAKEGQTDALTTIWQDDLAVFYHNPSMDPEEMTFLKTFMVENYYSHSYVDHTRGNSKRFKILEQGWEYDIKAPGQDGSSKFAAGYLIKNAI